MRLLKFSWAPVMQISLCFLILHPVGSFVSGEETPAPGDDLSMVVNLNHEPRNFGGYQNMGPAYSKTMGALFFAGWDQEHGVELWKTREGSEECQRVTDLLVGMASSQPIEITPWKDQIFFSARSGDSKRSLWKSDGTEAGTVPVFPAGSDAAPSDPHHFLPGKDCLFFYAHTKKSIISQIWRTDGTAEGTFVIYTFRKSGGSIVGNEEMPTRDRFILPDSYCCIGNELIWTVSKDPAGYAGFEFWKSDGTLEGTKIFYEAHTPFFISAWDKVFFFENLGAMSNKSPVELWKTDGTSEGTIKLVEFPEARTKGRFMCSLLGKPGGIQNSGILLSLKEQIIFALCDPIKKNGQFWVSDGTPEGTHELQEFSSNLQCECISNLIAFQDSFLFFSYKTGSKATLWKADRLTRSAVSLLPDSESTMPGSGDTICHAMVGNSLLLGWKENQKLVLWRTDEKASGICRIESVPIDGTMPCSFIQGKNTCYFILSGSRGPELWMSDGTASGTKKIESAKLEDGSTRYMNFMSMGDQLVFSNGTGLWKVEGDKVECLRSDITCSPDRIFREYAVSDELLACTGFYLNSPDYSWMTVTDGTTSGTRLLKLAKRNDQGEDRFCFRGLGKKIFFLQNTKGRNGRIDKKTVLYVSDGSQERTEILKKFDRRVTNMLPFDGKMLFFLERSSWKNIEIWISDGTPRGTKKFESLDTDDYECQDAVVVGENLVFTTATGSDYFNDSQVSHTLWVCNGHPKETYSINKEGQFKFSPVDLVAAGKNAFFRTQEPGYYNYSIWCTDGTPSGTKKVLAYDSKKSIVGYSPMGDSLIFMMSSHDEKGLSYHLWKSDGTPKGTSLVKEQPLIIGEAKLSCWIPCKNRVYFLSEEKGNTRIWETDGTNAGTTELQADSVGLLTIAPEDESILQPPRLAVCGDRLYFMASDTRHGKELWSCRIPFRKTTP